MLKLSIIIFLAGFVMLFSIKSIFVRINSYVLISMAIIDWETHTIPNELTMYFLLVNIFSSDSKLFRSMIFDFNFYTAISLLLISFLISVLSESLGFGDFKLMLASFIIFSNETFLNLFFVLSILVFVYSLFKLVENRSLQIEIAMGPFFFMSYIMLNF